MGYGGGGATNSIRQFSEILEFIKIKILDERVTIGEIWDAFDEKGDIKAAANLRGRLFFLIRARS